MKEKLIGPFKLGIDPYPDWFKGLDQSKLDFKVKEDTGELISVTIRIGVQPQVAKVGDVIGKVGRDVVVIPANIAKLFM